MEQKDTEEAERHPLQSPAMNDDGYEGSPPKKTKRLPPRFELSSDTDRWKELSSPSPSPSSSPSPSNSFRRKFVFTVPGIMRPKQPREYKLKIFVCIMFFVIILMISLTYVFHQQYLLQRHLVSIGDHLRFYEETQNILIMNAHRKVVLQGHLGMRFPKDTLPTDCQASGVVPNATTVCVEWFKLARVNISPLPDSSKNETKCSNIEWQALQPGVVLQDCYHMEGDHWYGVGETNPQMWPLESMALNDTRFQTMNLTTGPFGTVLDRFWLTSKGVAIMVDSQVPLFINLHQTIPGYICFGAEVTDRFPYATTGGTTGGDNSNLAMLSYTVCSSSDIKTAHRHVSTHLKPSVNLSDVIVYTIDNIVWSTRQRFGDNINDSLLFQFADKALQYDATHPGILLVERGWQENEGDLKFDAGRFSDPVNTITILKNKGFKVGLGVHPYVSTESLNYYKYVDSGWWINDVTGRVASLTLWDDLVSVAMVDFSNRRAAKWFKNALRALRTDYHVDGFHFCGGESTTIPPYHKMADQLVFQDKYALLYNDVAAETKAVFATCLATQGYSTSGFVQLSPRKSNWGLNSGLQSLIPAVISSGLVGHPFVLTGPVGGVVGGVPGSGGFFPEKELFIRWMEVTVFFPVFQFSILPSEYNDTEVQRVAEEYILLRRNLIVPTLKKLISEAAESRTPLIRPLWWLSPNDLDQDVFSIGSQFMVGDNLMVAPVLAKGKRECDLYIPPGMWRDRNKQIHRGGKWIYGFPAELGKIPYFVRDEFTKDFVF